MKVNHLRDLANILRRDSIISTTQAGSGHPTSCMSCAEIMSCLFFSEMEYDIQDPDNLNNDEFIMSKGHAAPILYSALKRSGCIDTDIITLRKADSHLEGHPMPISLPWVKVATGSLGQGLSIGVGMALAAKLSNKTFRTFVLLGDSEMAEGSIYEAAQLASHYKLNNLVAILDANRLGQTKETMVGHDLKKYKDRFKSFGWNTIIINGHVIEQVLSALNKAHSSKTPTIIIAKTLKGNGVSFLENKEGWHGKALNNKDVQKALAQLPDPLIPPIITKYISKHYEREIKTMTPVFPNYKLNDGVATREAYGHAIASLAKANSKVLAIDAEVSNSTHSQEVRKVRKNQFIETYIAEQNMLGVSLGLSKKGYSCFASTFAAFLTRAYDQIRMAALSSANMTISGSHAGVSIGQDGASQMGLEDIAMFRNLPDSYVFYPSDAVSTCKLIEQCSNLSGIKYIRTTRAKTPVIYKKNEKFKPGDFKVVRKSNKDKVVIVGAGITLHEALKANEELQKQKLNTAVVDVYSIKPFNSEKFIEFVKNHGSKVLVVEDHRCAGGIGEMISSSIINEKIKFKHLCVEGIPHSATPQELLETHKIAFNSIIDEVKTW